MVGSEERDRSVSPVVDQSRRTILHVKLIYRQKFHGSNTNVFEVWDFLDYPGVSAAPLLRHARIWILCESTNMHLVHDRLRDRPLERKVPLPVVRTEIGNHALHRGGSIIARQLCASTAVFLGN